MKLACQIHRLVEFEISDPGTHSQNGVPIVGKSNPGFDWSKPASEHIDLGRRVAQNGPDNVRFTGGLTLYRAVAERLAAIRQRTFTGEKWRRQDSSLGSTEGYAEHRRRQSAVLAFLTSRSSDAFLRVYVTQPARAGLREDVLEALPYALEIRIDPEFAAAASTGRAAPKPDRSPSELFGDYCAQHGVDDARVQALFDELHDAVTSPTDAALATGTGS